MVSNWTPLKSKSFKAHSSHADKQFNYKPMHFNPKKISWINGINKKPNFCLEVALCGIGGNLGDLWSSRLQRGSDSALQHSVQRAAAPCCRRMQDTLYTHSLGSLDSSPIQKCNEGPRALQCSSIYWGEILLYASLCEQCSKKTNTVKRANKRFFVVMLWKNVSSDITIFY